MQISFVQTDFAVYLCRFYIFHQQKRPLYGLGRAMSNRVFRCYENVYLNLTLSRFNPLPKLARAKDKMSQWLWLESCVAFWELQILVLWSHPCSILSVPSRCL